MAQTTEAEILGRRVQELEARLSDQMRVLAEREFECGELRDKVKPARKTEADLRAEIAARDDPRPHRRRKPEAEKTLIEDQLTQSRDEQTKLQQRDRHHEARGGADLGRRARGERAAARAHQRHRRRDRTADRRAGRTDLADRGDAGSGAWRQPTGPMATTATATPARSRREARATSPIASAPCKPRRREFQPPN